MKSYLLSIQMAVQMDGRTPSELWAAMADELVMMIAEMLAPVSTASSWQMSPLSDLKHMHALSSIGASRWVRLCKSLFLSAPWRDQLNESRRVHYETAACCRVLESHHSEDDDWPLQVLRLRHSKFAAASNEQQELSTALSHALPISRQTLRASYCAVAKDVHPDRLQVSLPVP